MSFDMQVVFLDGTSEVIPKIEDYSIDAGVLNLFVLDAGDVKFYMGYPLTSIRKYRPMAA